jgi:hypothetical protein
MPSPLPGGGTIRRAVSRQPLLHFDGALKGVGVIDSELAYDGANVGYETEIRPGWIMAQVTASKKWVPCKRTQAAGAGSTTASLVVDNAAAFKAGENLQIGSTTGTIDSIDYSTNTITLTATKSWSDNDVVYSTSNAGAEIGRAVMPGVDAVDLYDPETRAVRDMQFEPLLKGVLNVDMLLGDAAAIRAATNKLGGFNFSDDLGQDA